MKQPILATCLAAICLLATDLDPAALADPDPGPPYQARIEAVMGSLAADDRDAVASAMEYPLRFWNEGREIFAIGSPADLLVNYDAIFTADNRALLLALDTAAYTRYTQGIMLGAGEIWFDGDGARIRALNFFDRAIDLETAPFAAAYRSARDLGLAEFLWRGAPYTTD